MNNVKLSPANLQTLMRTGDAYLAMDRRVMTRDDAAACLDAPCLIPSGSIAAKAPGVYTTFDFRDE